MQLFKQFIAIAVSTSIRDLNVDLDLPKPFRNFNTLDTMVFSSRDLTATNFIFGVMTDIRDCKIAAECVSPSTDKERAIAAPTPVLDV
ncbi:hypothetical protein OH492_28840 [Vibrio chagasii]|nr:hypothetical protein [Vibrio chagasii]